MTPPWAPSTDLRPNTITRFVHYARRWFIAPQLTLNTNKFYFYYDNHIDSQYRKRQFGGALDVGYTFGKCCRGASRLSGCLSKRYSPVIGDTAAHPTQSGRVGITRFHYNLDLADDPVLPMRGITAIFRGNGGGMPVAT